MTAFITQSELRKILSRASQAAQKIASANPGDRDTVARKEIDKLSNNETWAMLYFLVSRDNHREVANVSAIHDWIKMNADYLKIYE